MTELKPTYKALAMLGIGKIGWIEVKTPECGPLDVICRPIALAPCTSDIHTVWAGSIGDRHNLVLGHEAIGQVVKAGALVKLLKVGDKVIVPAITPDWGSSEAQMGVPQHSGGCLCGWKFSNTKDGVFGEYFHVNEADANLAKLPEGMDPAVACMLCDMTTTGFHGGELSEVKLGDTVAIIGIGPVGLMAVQGAALLGASRIFAVGSRKHCCEVARNFGATDIIDYHNGPIDQQILKLNGDKPVDRVIIAGGDVNTFAEAVRLVRPGGIIGSVNYLGDGDNIPIPRLDWGVGMSHKHIHGGLTPGGRVRMEKLANLITYGKIHPEMLITHQFEGLEKVEDALMLMKNKPADVIKPIVIIKYNDNLGK